MCRTLIFACDSETLHSSCDFQWEKHVSMNSSRLDHFRWIMTACLNLEKSESGWWEARNLLYLALQNWYIQTRPSKVDYIPVSSRMLFCKYNKIFISYMAICTDRIDFRQIFKKNFKIIALMRFFELFSQDFSHSYNELWKMTSYSHAILKTLKRESIIINFAWPYYSYSLSKSSSKLRFNGKLFFFVFIYIYQLGVHRRQEPVYQ